jgi:hypothetical protein
MASESEAKAEVGSGRFGGVRCRRLDAEAAFECGLECSPEVFESSVGFGMLAEPLDASLMLEGEVVNARGCCVEVRL